jgi:hypothetical protein
VSSWRGEFALFRCVVLVLWSRSIELSLLERVETHQPLVFVRCMNALLNSLSLSKGAEERYFVFFLAHLSLSLSLKLDTNRSGIESRKLRRLRNCARFRRVSSVLVRVRDYQFQLRLAVARVCLVRGERGYRVPEERVEDDDGFRRREFARVCGVQRTTRGV